MKNTRSSGPLWQVTTLVLVLASWIPIQAQEVSTAGEPADESPAQNEEIVVLSPFEVSTSAEEAEGYKAATTLAGNRLKTELRDVGSAVQVITDQFLKDTGATDNRSLLLYTTNTEAGGVDGNFAGVGDGARLNEDTVRPNENTRIRGLAAADNTRDFFRTEIPWDSYNVDRVDLQRGPNSILFGQGSPAGIINSGTRSAGFRNSGELEARVGSYGSWRASLDLNRELVDDQIAVRLNLLDDEERFQQEPAHSKDRRIYGALRVDPAFLRQGNAHTIFRANFESGEIDSNNPRQLPPTDTITPWFTALNQATYSGMQLWDHLTGRINHGQERDAGYAAPNSGPIPYFQPWIGNFGTGIQTEPVAFFDGSSAPAMWITEVSAQMQSRGLGPNGQQDGGIGGFAAAPGRMRAINGTALWAAEARMPYSAAGIHKDNRLTDSSIFDFYNQLIDGDTKREWQDFDSATLNLTQTFMDDKFGVSLDYNTEDYNSGQVALLSGNVLLGIDPMAVFADGTPDAGQNGDPFSDGTPNPNVGRPFVMSQSGTNNSFTSDREAKRATAFFTHDFARKDQSTLNRMLGTHTFTGLFSDEQQETDSRTWQRYGYFSDTAYALQHLDPAGNAFNSAGMIPASVIYLGPSLLGSPVAGAKIPRIAGTPTLTSGSVRYFDDHWRHPLDPNAAGYVNPGAAWTNYFFPTSLSQVDPAHTAAVDLTGTGTTLSTQSENPANYVGWTTAQLDVTDSEAAPGNRDRLTTAASLRKSVTTSQALVWQGKMLDDSIVGTFGWRKDVNKSWKVDRLVSTNPASPDYKQIGFDTYQLPTAEDARVEVQSRSYSVVAHLMDLPGLKGVTENLPFAVSLFYNESTNFKPDASRVDVLGESLASPSGKTIDKGIMIETRDGRYSVRINRYETAIKNASGDSSIGYDFGNWMGHGAIYANIFEYDIGNWEWAKSPSNYQQDNPMRYDFFVNNLPDDSDDEATSIAGYREFQRQVDPRFWSAWGFTSLEHVQSGDAIPLPGEVHVPAGFTVSEDSISKGWEIELAGEPVRNWRLMLNASQAEAVRYNIGGENMRALMDLIATAIEGPAGRLHFWWGTDDVPRTKAGWYNYLNNPGAQWASRKLLEGSNVPELREWRLNLVTTYDITTGALQGVNYGGGMRYQSAVAIGYPPLGDPNNPGDYSMDLAHPYEGPSETNFDFWVGYRRPLTEKITWNIQLNVRNAFNSDDLIPITVQGPIDNQIAGTPAGYRLAPTRSFFLTNRFSF